MRIVIHEDDEKTKFFRMATLFAREYNQHVAPEDRARITLPYSFILSKLSQPFPDMVPHIVSGNANNKFAKLVRDYHMHENGGLFDFQFTHADEKLYAQMYNSAVRVVGSYVTQKQLADAEKKKKTSTKNGGDENLDTDEIPPISSNGLREIRERAKRYDEIMGMLGIETDSWFKDNHLGNNSTLPNLVRLSPISKVAVYMAMLQTPETQKLLDIGESDPIPAPNTATGRAFHKQKLELASTLITNFNRYDNSRAITQSRPTVESMSSRHQDTPAITNNQMREIVGNAEDITDTIRTVTPERLIQMGIADGGKALQYENVGGAALLHALCRTNSVRKKIIEDSAIQRSRNDGMLELALQGKEETLFATDEVEKTNERLHKQKEERIFDMHALEVEHAAAAPGEKIGGAAHVSTKRDEPAPPPEVPGLKVCDSGALFNVLRKKLEAFKDFDHEQQERDTLKNRKINECIAQMQMAITTSGHNGGCSGKVKVADQLAEDDRSGFIGGVDGLEKTTTQLGLFKTMLAAQYEGQEVPSDVQHTLGKLERQIRGHQRRSK